MNFEFLSKQFVGLKCSIQIQFDWVKIEKCSSLIKRNHALAVSGCWVGHTMGTKPNSNSESGSTLLLVKKYHRKY